MFLIRLISRLPLRLLYVVSDFIFVVAFYLVRYRRRLVRTNLRRSFPEKQESEIAGIEKQFYRNLCDYGVETLKLATINEAELKKRMVFVSHDIPATYAKQHQSILILASHQFNWEWLLACASINYPLPVDFVYQPVKSSLFNRFILEARTRWGAYAIKRDEVARELVRRREIIRGIATVADQYPGYGHDKKFETVFLNQDTVFFYGTNQMAALTQYPAVFYNIKKVRRGYYEARPVIVGTPPYEKNGDTVIENYVREVERAIRDEPAGWLWSHNRWKTRHLTTPPQAP